MMMCNKLHTFSLPPHQNTHTNTQDDYGGFAFQPSRYKSRYESLFHCWYSCCCSLIDIAKGDLFTSHKYFFFLHLSRRCCFFFATICAQTNHNCNECLNNNPNGVALLWGGMWDFCDVFGYCLYLPNSQIYTRLNGNDECSSRLRKHSNQIIGKRWTTKGKMNNRETTICWCLKMRIE